MNDDQVTYTLYLMFHLSVKGIACVRTCVRACVRVCVCVRECVRVCVFFLQKTFMKCHIIPFDIIIGCLKC